MPALPPAVTVESTRGSGAVFDHGAQVVSWVPAGHGEVLWMAPHATLDSDAAIRGGVPIVFPWFGSGRSGHLTPAHGFARRTSWTLVSVSSGPDGLEVTHVLSSAGVDEPSFPFDFVATHTARFGSTLDLTLAVENTGPVPFSFEEALHTYLQVGDVTTVRVTGLDGAPYLDQVAVSGPAMGTQAGDVTITTETDRIYSSPATVTVIDPTLGRATTVSKSRSAETVVWNPWIDRARTMPDIGDQWRTMLCIEAANVRGSAVALEPGQSHTMGCSIAVARLQPGASGPTGGLDPSTRSA